MGIKFLTPKLVWDKYDPEAESLESNILSTSQDEHMSRTKYCFTSETTKTGKVRASIEVFYDSRWLDKRPAIIFNPSIGGGINYYSVSKLKFLEGTMTEFSYE